MKLHYNISGKGIVSCAGICSNMNRFACDCVFSLFTTLSTAISRSSSFMEIGTQSFQYVCTGIVETKDQHEKRHGKN